MGQIDLSSQLKAFEPQDAIAILDALEGRRKQEHFSKYWRPNSPGQWDASRGFTKEVKTFVVRGGNRSGKSDLGAAITVAWALGKEYFLNEPAYEWVKNLPIPEPPSNIWVVGLDFSVIRDVLWGEKLRLGGSHPPFLPRDESLITKVSESEFWIQLENGSRITCKSADSGREKFQGASVDFIWMDEECDVEIYNECYQRTIDCNGKILVTLTPSLRKGENHIPWVFDLHEDYTSGKTKNVRFASLSVIDNPCVPEDEKELLLEKWAGHPEERARLYGEFIQRSGLVYSMYKPARHQVKRFQIPKSWLRVACIDPSLQGGTTACLWAAVEPETNNMFLYKEYYAQDMPISEHAKSIILRSSGDLVDVWLIDPKAGVQHSDGVNRGSAYKTVMQIYKEAGIPVKLAEVGQDYGLAASLEYMVATTQAQSRHPKVFIFEDLKTFQWEISRYIWDYFARGALKGESKEKPIKRHDHLMNAFQYVCAMRPRARRASAVPRETQIQEARINSYT